jgi:hypothetical protein
LVLTNANPKFGDVVEVITYTGNYGGIEVHANNLYYQSQVGDSDAVFVRPLPAGSDELIGIEKDVRAITFCGDDLWIVCAWPGRVCRKTEMGFEQFKSLRQDDGVDFVQDAAYDGQYLWYIETDSFINRFGLAAIDPATGKTVYRIQSDDKQITGLAWDGRSFWLSSETGWVYEVDRAMAIERGSVGAAKRTPFPGEYHSLAYSPGFLWGLDQKAKRICKIKLTY